MSSTGRSDVRRADDFYRTEAHVTRAILGHLPRLPVLDPCCGDGAILDAVHATWGTAPSALCGIELDETRALAVREKGYLCGARDALGPESWPAAYRGLVVTNPPFSLAEEFVRRALTEIAPTGGTIAMLFRLAFLETAKRASFHVEHPSDVFVLSKRPSFTEDGKTDSCAYAWFVWGPNRGGRWQILATPNGGVSGGR
jgi:hypothetical protein